MEAESKLIAITLPSGSPWEWGELSTNQFEDVVALSDHTPAAPIYQYAAVRRCLALREGVEAGNGFDTLECVRICGTHGLVMPAWLVQRFNQKYDAVLNFRAKSWDDPLSFGPPNKPGTNPNASRKTRRMRPEIWNRLVDIIEREPSTPIDKELFVRAGKDVNPPITGRRANDLYQEAKNILGLSSLKDIRAKNPTLTPEEQTFVHLNNLAILARAAGRTEFSLGGLVLAYPNAGPQRETEAPVASTKTARSKPPKNSQNQGV